MIRTAQGIWKRSIEVAKETVPEYFLDYPYAEDLRIGWYPSAIFFREECHENFAKALPELTGAVFPYFHDYGTLSHVLIASYTEEGVLNPRRRSILSDRGEGHRKLSAVFGLHRLKHRRAAVVATDDELLVCKFDHTIAISRPSQKVANLIRRSTPVVKLKSSNPKWIEQMYSLAKHGLQVEVNDRPLVDHMADIIIRMYHENMGLSVITGRIADLLENLVPMERVAVIQLVKQATNISLEHVLPDDFHIYRREGDFYAKAQEVIKNTFHHIKFTQIGISFATKDKRYEVPYNNHAVAAAVCDALDVELDLVDWVYRDLKEIPHFYLYRDKQTIETRAAVNFKIAEILMTILSREAARSMR